MNLNHKQIISIISAVLSVLMISTTQLTDLFGAGIAKTVVTIAGLANTILSSVMAAITSQASLVKDVQSMPGVEKIVTNRAANETLNQLAIDPVNTKIEKGN